MSWIIKGCIKELNKHAHNNDVFISYWVSNFIAKNKETGIAIYKFFEAKDLIDLRVKIGAYNKQ